MTTIHPAPTAAHAAAPCPHCGAEPIVHDIEPHTHTLSIGGFKMPNHPGSTVVECPSCPAGMIADTRDEAIAAWNRRTPAALILTRETE